MSKYLKLFIGISVYLINLILILVILLPIDGGNALNFLAYLLIIIPIITYILILYFVKDKFHFLFNLFLAYFLYIAYIYVVYRYDMADNYGPLSFVHLLLSFIIIFILGMNMLIKVPQWFKLLLTLISFIVVCLGSYTNFDQSEVILLDLFKYSSIILTIIVSLIYLKFHY